MPYSFRTLVIILAIIILFTAARNSEVTDLWNQSHRLRSEDVFRCPGHLLSLIPPCIMNAVD